MKYPAAFYFSQLQSGREFTTRPTGHMSIPQLLRSRPNYWVSPNPPREVMPRKLILADWSAGMWSVSNVKNIQHKLAELMDNGFQIYMAQLNHLTPLTKDNLWRLNDKTVRDAMKPLRSEEITHAAANLHPRVTHDELLVLDNYWVEQLIEEQEDPGPRTLRTSDLKSHSFFEVKKIIAMQSMMSPPLSALLLDEPMSKDILDFIRQELPHLPLTTHYQSLSITEYDIEQLNAGNHATPYTLNGKILELEDLSNLREIIISPGLQDIGPLLSKMTALQKFMLGGGLIFDTFPLTCEPGSLTSIIEFQANNYEWGDYISSVWLQKLFEATPNLRSLILDIEIIDNFPSALTLPHLEAISCSNKLDLSHLESLINATTHLKKLDLFFSSLVLDELLPVILTKLTYLDTLKLSAYNLEQENLISLIRNCRQLKSLALRQLSLEKCSVLPYAALPQIENLTLHTSIIDMADFSQHLKNSLPGLKTLRLPGSTLVGPVEIESGELPSLEALDVANTDIEYEDLIRLCSASHLKELKIWECNHLRGLFSSPIKGLEHLEKLTINKLSRQDILVILEAAPHLKFLEMPKSEWDSLGEGLQQVILTRKIEVTDLTFNAHPMTLDHLSLYKTTSTAEISTQHNPDAMRDYKPKETEEEEKPIQFLGGDTTQDQGMLIKKLARYATMTGKHNELIPKIKNGMCNALSRYFLDTPLSEWDRFIKEAQDWTDEILPSSHLERHFELLVSCIKGHQIDQSHEYLHYIGDNLDTFLATNEYPCHLANPWHAIAIKPLPGTDRWIVYDPNYLTGYKEIARHELTATIHQAVGHCVFIKNQPDIVTEPRIEDPRVFIRNGGLLALVHANNIEAMLPQLKEDIAYDTDDLDGILLRDTAGEPAWTNGLTYSKTAALTLRLLQSFLDNHPTDGLAQLQRSLSIMSPAKRQEIATRLIQYRALLDPDKEHCIHAVLDCLLNPTDTDFFERQLQTWKAAKPSTPSLLSYCQSCFATDDVKKRLIKMSSSEDVDALHYALLAHAKTTHRPVYYIHSPDDLICSVPYVHHHPDDSGELRKGPGGPFFNFLEEARRHDESPIIIVNYDNFKPDDIVRFNALLDKEPKADGVPLPDKAAIIGLIDVNNPDSYQGADFYSRMDSAERFPLSSQTLQHALPTWDDNAPSAPPQVIELYGASDWKERLLGRWELNGDNLFYEEGLLPKALAAGATSLDIHNGPWYDPAFTRFWREALQAGVIQHEGRSISIPPEMKLLHQEGYDWEHLKTPLQKTLSDAPRVALNPTTLGDFLKRHQVSIEGKFLYQDGFIKTTPSGNTLPVYLTRPLSENEWAVLLSECQAQRVQLNVCCAPGVQVPEALQDSVINTTDSAMPADWTTSAPTQVIKSTDSDTTIALLTQEASDSLILDVSECSGADLFTRTNGKLKQDTLRFEFSSQTSAVTKALEEGKRVILKGFISPELADELAPILLRRQEGLTPGTLLIVTEDTSLLSYYHQHQHLVSMEEKEACLSLAPEQREALAPYLEKEPLSKLIVRRDYLIAHPGANSDEAWVGLRDLPQGIDPLEPLNITNSKEQTEAFIQGRKDAVNAVLSHAPYVFLSGLSGVGKSIFIEQEFLEENDTLFHDENNMKSWALDNSSAGRKFLFIDEANLSPKQWSELESLFHEPPGLLIDGAFYPVSPNHKIIFAGNPVTYGDERHLAPFFQRHGQALLFNPLPTAFLYERILKPVFKDTLLEGPMAQEISQHLLEVYRFLCNCSTSEILISPRELQMMALMIHAHISQLDIDQQPDIKAITEHFAYQIAAPLVPGPHKKNFEDTFRPARPLPLPPPSVDAASGFLITPSRFPISHALNDWLALRELRQEPTANKAQRTGGLGGLILEGEPGAGKSELVIASLRARGYEEIHNLSNPTTHPKAFYRLPVSMPPAEKEKCLIHAFNEGLVVVIDEINSSPMMERLLNELLMGTYQGQAANKPGFMVLGTQNPITMAGRRAPSTALARRTTTIELPPYNTQELIDILSLKGIATDVAKSMAVAYEKQVAHAAKHHLVPQPTFRDLLRLADRTLQAQHRVQDYKQQSAAIETFEAVTPLASSSQTLSASTTEAFKAMVLSRIKAVTPPKDEPSLDGPAP